MRFPTKKEKKLQTDTENYHLGSIGNRNGTIRIRNKPEKTSAEISILNLIPFICQTSKQKLLNPK